MSDVIDQMAAQIAERVIPLVVDKVTTELQGTVTEGVKLVWTDEEAADLLGCSAQTMADRRKKKLIGSTTNPAGRPVYMLHHLVNYLLQGEKTAGKAKVTVADLLNFSQRKPVAQ